MGEAAQQADEADSRLQRPQLIGRPLGVGVDILRRYRAMIPGGFMTHEEILREFASLPPEGRRQVIDFIAFLHQRYRRLNRIEESEISGLTALSFPGDVILV